jgi:hypothetical protein
LSKAFAKSIIIKSVCILITGNWQSAIWLEPCKCHACTKKKRINTTQVTTNLFP